MASQLQTLITAEQFYQLPEEEGREFELLDGEVIEMSSAMPLHNVILGTFSGELYLALRGLGRLMPETDFSDGRTTVLRPDLAILLNNKFATLDLKKLPVTVPPEIVVEVISPSESALRVERRIRAYLRFGVQEVWIVYPEDCRMYIHSESSITRRESGDTLQTPLLPGWSILIDRLFER